MEINIFVDNKPAELKPLVMPKMINENLDELQHVFSDLVDNVKLIEFIEIQK
jgi:hypothetical protein